MTKNKIFLLDAMALIFRAYYALNKQPRLNSKGLNTSAILGFTNTLFDVIKNEKPTHLGVAFESMSPTFRVQEYEQYKSTRQETPSDIVLSIPYIKKIIEGFGIPILTYEGYEADDVVGTMAKRAEKEGFEVFMMTTDKDFGQLVSENIRIYKPAKNGDSAQKIGVEEVCEKYSITKPEQLIDILGLWGDAVDNIPGVPGVGEVTAKKLISQFGSIENLIENAQQIENEKLKEKIINFKEQALLSKKLATIIIDIPLEISFEQLKYENPNKEVLKSIFDELEFRNLAQRIFTHFSLSDDKENKSNYIDNKGQFDLFGSFQTNNSNDNENNNAPTLQNINTTQHNYFLLTDEGEIEKLIGQIKKKKKFTFDTETTGLDSLNDDIVGMSLSIKPFEAYYLPLPNDKSEAQELLKKFKDIFEDSSIEKTGQNLKFDINILNQYNIKVKGKLFDTMLAHYLLEPELRHNMTILSQTYLNYQPIEIESLIGKKGVFQRTMRSVKTEVLKDYAAEDADVTIRLKEKLEPELKDKNLINLFYNIETPLVYVLSKMEQIGVKIDKEALNIYSKELENEINLIKNSIYQHAGQQFNIASPKQLGEILFDKLEIDKKAKLTKTKQYQTGEEVLVKLKDKHPIINDILEFRTLSKLKSTYVDSLPLLENPQTGRIHTTFNQTTTATGRLSSTNPNLQNIPIRTEKGREIRKAFIPRNEDYLLLAADYSQIELRIIAELSKDENMLEAFRNGLDIHTSTASKVFNVPINEVSKEMRRNAKAVNFGIIYGISAFGLAEQLGCTRSQASEWINEYFNQFSGIKNFIDKQIDFAKENGFVETIFKRRRYLRDINSNNNVVRSFAQRNAVNAPIQGSAADIIKLAMVNIDKVFEEKKFLSKLIIQVHDELVFDVKKDELEIVTQIVKQEMTSVVKMSIPLEVDINFGKNWLEAH